MGFPIEAPCGRVCKIEEVRSKHYEEGRTDTYPCGCKVHISLADSSGTQDTKERLCQQPSSLQVKP